MAAVAATPAGRASAGTLALATTVPRLAVVDRPVAVTVAVPLAVTVPRAEVADRPVGWASPLGLVVD
jgi:hypothetical protein